MDSGDFLSTVKMCEFEGVFSNLKGVFLGDSLDGFDDTRVDFVLDTGEFSLAVLTDDNNIDVLMAGLDSRESEGRGDISEETEFIVELPVLNKLGTFVDGRDDT